MINPLALRLWLNSRGYPQEVHYLMLADEPDRTISFTVEEVESKGTVSTLSLTVYVRAEHPEPAIEVASAINADLDMMTQTFIDNTQIILFKANNMIPVPYGIDENKRHIFSVQFKMLVSPTDKLNVRD